MSDPGSGGPLVCGFSDLASGFGGLAWRLGAQGGLILDDGGVQAAEVEISEADESVELRLASTGGETQATLTPRPSRLALETPEGTPPGGGLEASVCSAEVKPAGENRTLRCFGHLSGWAEDPSAAPGAFRHLAVERSDGSLLLVVARGEGADHGAEQSAAWLLDGEGMVSAFGEALLSTQYDKDGRVTRAGLELRPEGDETPPMRAAGIRLGGSEADGLSAALLRCSTEGSEGLGGYLIKRG